NIRGLGYGIAGGAGVVLSGPQSSVFRAIAETSLPWSASVNLYAFGAAQDGGFGAFADAGGDDSYEATGTAVALDSETVDDSCLCTGVQALAAAAENGVAVQSMGYGETG